MIRFPLPPAPSLHHPSPEYARLRAEDPVPKVELPDGSPAYLATRHADVRTVFSDPRFSRAAATGPKGPEWELGSLADDSLLGMDPPLHTKVRRVVGSAFTARRVEDLRATVAGLVDGMVDRLEEAGPGADLSAHVSAPLPIAVISGLFGVADEDQDRVKEWSDALVGDWRADPGPPRAALASFGELIEKRRANPGDDLMSALVAAWDREDSLSERELVSVTAGLLAGGHESTTNQINLFVTVLSSHLDQLAALRGDDPHAVAVAVEELTRYIQLGESGILMPRVALEDVDLGGVTVPAGSVVLPAVVSANRDESVFPDADRLDLTRSPNPHIGYGAGAHHCIGASLARMELQEALGGLLRRLPNLRLAVPESELRLKPGLVVRSFQELPVTWDR
ncbi:cytochrome P450 [Saccharothrix sp. 6-C]|uniref:cytochrome P450 n=1 Tax=Saccharothrix sp. 6-C TaxID=2781735 RepID=UPI00191745C3|nr:cytochrome P450 [Saccharothrix sp. 6-C]QQQ74108.1 cytochrome P450 [Saccharothrix sp. 6-C]